MYVLFCIGIILGLLLSVLLLVLIIRFLILVPLHLFKLVNLFEDAVYYYMLKDD